MVSEAESDKDHLMTRLRLPLPGLDFSPEFSPVRRLLTPKHVQPTLIPRVTERLTLALSPGCKPFMQPATGGPL